MGYLVGQVLRHYLYLIQAQMNLESKAVRTILKDALEKCV
jgi:hypothetical protein